MFILLQICLLLATSVVSEAASLVGNFSEGSPVYGVGSAGDNIHVIHESTSNIRVYGKPSDGYPLKELINVAGMKGPYDMIVFQSAFYELATIVDWFDGRNIFQVTLHHPYWLNKWNFNPSMVTSVGLSGFVDKSDNFWTQLLLVTETATNKLKEFWMGGALRTSVSLRNITSPRQTIKISDTDYAVCFGYAATEKHQVCLVDRNGYTVAGQCFGGRPGSSLTQLNVPARLYQRRDGSILVADLKNQRILKLNNSSISAPAQVVVSKADGLSGPYRMFVDEDRSLLYVADNTLDPKTGYATKGRVLVYKI